MDLQAAAQLIQNAQNLVVLTGAGCSVDAGVPDFRSPTGWWHQIDPRTVATVEALETNYETFHSFYAARIEHLAEIQPHAGHHVLARWEQEGRLQLIATQNVDGLHQSARNRQVEELHGSIRTFRCHWCGQKTNQEYFLQKKKCACGGKLRPDVVLFGESLPQNAWNRSMQAIEKADVVLVIGTSLQVYPVTFVKDNSLEYRIEAQLKINGNSSPKNILLIMLNPGDSKLQDVTAWNLTKETTEMKGYIILDNTMEKTVYLLKKADPHFNGSVHIRNIFNLRHAKAQEAIQAYVFQKKNKMESPFLETDFSTVNLSDYDFTWVAWSLEANSHLNKRKKDVLCYLKKQGIDRIIGKFESGYHTRHLRPRLKKHQDEYESYIVPELQKVLALRK